jgi:phosphohistidine swiveling domain-containing protein
MSTQAKSELNYNGQDWFLTVTRNMSFWHQCLCNKGMFFNHRDFGVNAELRLLTLIVDSTKTSAFVFKENNDKYVSALVEATNTPEKMRNVKDKYEQFTDELLKALLESTQDLNVETFSNFIEKYQRYTGGLMITTSLGRVGLDQLTARLKEIGTADSEIPEIAAIITYPSEKTPFFNSQIDLLKIGIEVQKNGLNGVDLSRKLDEWLSFHGYVPVNFCEEPQSKAELEAQLRDVLKGNCEERLAMLEKQHEESISKAEKLLTKINDGEVRRLAHLLADVTTLNEFRKNIFCKVSLGYRPIFGKIVQKLGSSNWRDGFYLTSEEMLDVIGGKGIDLQALIKERKRVAMYVDAKGELVFLPKEEVEKIYRIVYEAKSQPTPSTSLDGVIKGFSASRGKVRGIVKIILSSADFSKLLPGEILVTTMTSVDFVPVMERAGAFVTNEGGITSHASIVAREMKKPCIIGTKNATQILKDGDMVEVDAERGIVSIIHEMAEK